MTVSPQSFERASIAMPAPASTKAVFTNWGEGSASLWGQHPLKLTHTLHNSPLFSRSALIELIEAYPRENYALVHMGGQKDSRLWQEGDRQPQGWPIIEAIGRGRMWLNLRDVSTIDIDTSSARRDVRDTANASPASTPRAAHAAF